MLDPKLFRNNLAELAQQLARRGVIIESELWESLELRRKEAQLRVQELQQRRNELARNRSSDPNIKTDLHQAETQFEQIQEQIQELALKLPNIPDSSIPDGQNEEANVELKSWGQIPKFDFAPKEHGLIGEFDFERAVKISGARFSAMFGKLAQLQRALAQFMLDLHTKEHGYTEVYVPYLINSASMQGSGQLPKFAMDSFKIADSDLWLAPTAEVPLANLYRNEILEALPLKLVAHTPCFRKEAGTYGKDTRGIIRQHQFEKVELMQFVRPQESYRALDEMLSHATKVLELLELPYRVMTLCSGDMGFSAAKTFDIEVWMPSQNCYREISSCSNTTDFQARRLGARWRNPENKKPELLHILNGSGVAVGRCLAAVLENYQNEQGEYLIPEVLKKYM